MDDKIIFDLFNAYYEARRNKCNTINALAFEINYEKELFRLAEDILARKHQISSSICFINFKPVQREIFAADFRDRVIHHLVYNYISPVFEKLFINDSYSCRKGKGTSYGINRIRKFISQCSHNYLRDCYLMKLDIEGYFMKIDRELLYHKIVTNLSNYQDNLKVHFGLLLYLLQKIIFNDPVKNCLIKGKKSDWLGLPASKSLFDAENGKGLPIGNLTSQLFGNIYLNDFDHFVKKDLKIKYYGRYVDDMVFIHEDKNYLIYCREKINCYLVKNLILNLHPRKFYLQHFSKGINFLGAFILPYRMYAGRRLKRNFYQFVFTFNSSSKINMAKLKAEDIKTFRASINSYLGIMNNFASFRLRAKILGLLNNFIPEIIYVPKSMKKIIINQKLIKHNKSYNL